MRTTVTLTLALGFLASANAATIVYQDTFDDGVLATNPGIGGGFSQDIAGGSGFTESGGSIDADTSTNNNRAYGYSTNSFDLSDGFLLEFTASATNLGSTSANRFAVGLAAAGADFAGTTTSGRNWLGSNLALFEGVGVDFTTDAGSGGQGLSYNDGAGSVTVVTNAQTITASTDHAISLTVNADGSYSYSIDGATATTGADFGLDLTKEYHFATYFQDNEGDFAINEVTLTALDPIPEPSTTALLGLGGLALILRRRK
ncbi:PEP-CTERM sorting domain-containing protein [Verrucomicrobiaceae bacterium R5-34]|nr:PEP-CTERM sorting domain-containing protein [Verrucomicrobiaceae bacterium R5-34]